MLRLILRSIAEAPGATSLDDLAAALGTTRPNVERMISDLVRLGYLNALEAPCSSNACGACLARNSCDTPLAGRLWSPTAKGLRWLRSEQA